MMMSGGGTAASAAAAAHLGQLMEAHKLVDGFHTLPIPRADAVKRLDQDGHVAKNQRVAHLEE